MQHVELTSVEEDPESPSSPVMRRGDGGNLKALLAFLVRVPPLVLAYIACMCLVYFTYGVSMERRVVLRDTSRVVDDLSLSIIFLYPAERRASLVELLDALSIQTSVRRNDAEVFRGFLSVLFQLAWICPAVSAGLMLLSRLLVGGWPVAMRALVGEILLLTAAIACAEVTFVAIASRNVLVDKTTILHELAVSLKERRPP